MQSLLIGVGVPPAAAGNLAADLLSRYAEPHRRYHDGEHIIEVMAEADRLLSGVRSAPDDASAVRLAVWFHDAIYDPTAVRGANEDASAELASDRLLSLGVARTLVSEVARLVRRTADHVVEPTDVAGSVLVDADLSILASGRDRYDRYVRDVREEYGHVGDDAWRAGRGDVLRRFLDVPSLYRIGPDRAQRDRAARANMERELAGLRAPGSGPGGGPAGSAARRPGAVERVPGD